MRLLTLVGAVLWIVATANGEVFCNPRSGKKVTAVLHVFPRGCQPDGRVTVRVFGRDGKLLDRDLSIKAGIEGGYEGFIPETWFIAVPSSAGCVQGDTIAWGSNEACVAQFAFKYACPGTRPIDIEVDVGNGVTAQVTRKLAVTWKWTKAPDACVEDDPLSRNKVIEGVLDGETVDVVVQTIKLDFKYTHTVDLTKLRNGKTDKPSVDVIRNKGFDIGQGKAGISSNAADVLQVAFRRKRAG